LASREVARQKRAVLDLRGNDRVLLQLRGSDAVGRDDDRDRRDSRAAEGDQQRQRRDRGRGRRPPREARASHSSLLVDLSRRSAGPVEDAIPAMPADTRPTLGTVLREWGRIGCTGFGGPPAHIALLRKLCVDRERWIEPHEFEDAIAACNLLPGPAS